MGKNAKKREMLLYFPDKKRSSYPIHEMRFAIQLSKSKRFLDIRSTNYRIIFLKAMDISLPPGIQLSDEKAFLRTNNENQPQEKQYVAFMLQRSSQYRKIRLYSSLKDAKS